MSRRAPTTSEKGQVMPVFLAALVVIMLAAGLIVDLSPAFTKKIQQRACLERIDMELGLAGSMLCDSQTETISTAKAVADRALSTARAAGYEGQVTVWFYEPAPNGTRFPKVDDNDRLWAWEVELSDPAQTTFGKFAGMGDFTVSSATAGSANPYSRVEVWRNATDDVKLMWTARAGNNGFDNGSGTTWSDSPDSLNAEFERAYGNLRDY